MMACRHACNNPCQHSNRRLWLAYGCRSWAIACIENPSLMVKIIGHVRSRETRYAVEAPAPPADPQRPLKHRLVGWSSALR
jgi:hypothetical protein